MFNNINMTCLKWITLRGKITLVVTVLLFDYEIEISLFIVLYFPKFIGIAVFRKSLFVIFQKLKSLEIKMEFQCYEILLRERRLFIYEISHVLI